MKKTEELRSKFDAIFDKNLTEVDNWNSAVFYSDKQKFINELLEAINYTRCSLQLLCVDKGDDNGITKGREYKSIDVDETHYKIIDNYGDEKWFLEDYFKIID